jgi:hypothetical protein
MFQKSRAGVAVVLMVLLLAAGSAWAIGNPEPTSCIDSGDRLTKLTLADQLASSPQLLVLGSSRARVAMPDTVRQLTGRSAFNAGVHGGSAADEWVFTRLLATRFPHARPAYLILTDVGIAGGGVNPELADQPLARPFLGSDASPRKSTCVPNGLYSPDGGLDYPPVGRAQRLQLTATTVAQTLEGITAATERPTRIDPAQTLYFQRMLAFMNAHGATPVIALNPIYPSVLAKRRRYGFPERKAAAVYLNWLHTRYRFLVVDCEDIRRWGGKASDFINVDHIDRTNMARMLRYIVAHSNGVLRR